MSGKTIMIQGTASNVGKSIITAGLCRLLYRRGYKVAPFKAQNMSNNSFVTECGGEIGRAQAVQAEACHLKPAVDMNPILLKPDTDMAAQVVVRGRATTKIKSIGHPDYQNRFQPVVRNSLDNLRSKYDVVVIEGAGSPAEMNLKDRDIVNMNLALYANSPVILVGDIDWGGIFAQLVGTYELLNSDEKKLIKSFLINKFRGDKKILEPGITWIENRVTKPVLGVLPFISDLDIAEEDSIVAGDSKGDLVGLRANTIMDAVSGKNRDVRNIAGEKDKMLIDVMWLPRISNFTDFDMLKRRDDVVLRFLHAPDRNTLPDLIIIPGTKSTVADLSYLKKSGLANYILRAAQAEVQIFGICGGYQMLGETIKDVNHIESNEDECEGLGLLPLITEYEGIKTTKQVNAKYLQGGHEIMAYEIHMGKTKSVGETKNLFEILQPSSEVGAVAFEGHATTDGQVSGTYLHGIFDNTNFLDYFLHTLKTKIGIETAHNTRGVEKMDSLDYLADVIQQNIRQDVLMEMLE